MRSPAEGSSRQRMIEMQSFAGRASCLIGAGLEVSPVD